LVVIPTNLPSDSEGNYKFDTVNRLKSLVVWEG
jgi:hypothetical protein